MPAMTEAAAMAATKAAAAAAAVTFVLSGGAEASNVFFCDTHWKVRSFIKVTILVQ